MNNVLLTNEQQGALQYITRVYAAEDIVKKHSLTKNFWNNKYWSEPINVESLNSLSVDEMVRALYVGIDIKKSPQEVLGQCHKDYLDHFQSPYDFNDDEKRGFRLGLAVACFVLGENIKGITE